MARHAPLFLTSLTIEDVNHTLHSTHPLSPQDGFDTFDRPRADFFPDRFHGPSATCGAKGQHQEGHVPPGCSFHDVGAISSFAVWNVPGTRGACASQCCPPHHVLGQTGYSLSQPKICGHIIRVHIFVVFAIACSLLAACWLLQSHAQQCNLTWTSHCNFL